MAKTFGKEKRSLRYDFTASEIHELSLKLASQNQEVLHLEDEKKKVTSQIQSQINMAKADVNTLSQQVTNGWEYRNVECEVHYHTPVQGKKTIVRTDTGKQTSIEAMADHEWDLFNQPDNENSHGESVTEDTDAEVVGEESGPRLLGNGVDDFPE